ncbi:MAG TPA: nucleotidyltransferase family protein [Acidimicrobiia bacterium]|nr:nucleotidyltransferase family protein [Acidimicrobiia bacterium]
MSRPHLLVARVAAGQEIEPESVALDVVDSAIEHRMAGLLLHSCRHALEALPPESAAKLTAYDLGIAARRTRLLEVLRITHERLSEEGIPHIVFKGPVSATRYFPDPLLRPFADLDVVIPEPAHLLQAVHALIPDHPDLDVLKKVPPHSLDTLSVTIGDVSVDLQTDPLRMGIGPRQRNVWTKRTKTMELEGVGAIEVYDDEADLLIFLLHQARDRFRYALGIAEARLRFERDIEWTRVDELARQEGLFDQISVATRVIHEELGASSNGAPESGWRSRLWTRLWSPQVRLLGDVGRFRHKRRAAWLMPLTAQGRSWEAARWILHKAFPSDAELRLRHPSASGPYLWRLVWARIRIAVQQRLWARRRETSQMPSS